MMRASIAFCLASTAAAFQSAAPQAHTTALCATRGDVLKGAGVASLLAFAAPAQAAQRTQSGLIYEVQKSNPKGKQPVKGDLIAIRFKGATTDGNVFDDTTKTDEPLYYRVGTGSLIAGIEEILPMMRYKEKWAVQIPANLAFGSAGRKASAGKPRIPGGADLYYEIDFVAFPGFEGDIYLQD